MAEGNQWLKIYDRIGEAAALEMLAEEAAELIHTALKMARIVRGENPTPADWDVEYLHLAEEVGDLCNALDVLDEGLMGHDVDLRGDALDRWAPAKMTRWFRRLFGEEADHETYET